MAAQTQNPAGNGAARNVKIVARDTNVFYGLLKTLTNPFVKGARLISPKLVLDRHVPLVAFLLLAFVWIFATLFKVQLCLDIGVQACR